MPSFLICPIMITLKMIISADTDLVAEISCMPIFTVLIVLSYVSFLYKQIVVLHSSIMTIKSLT